jgi:C-terminal processing protease CtpA/Prc
LLDVSEFDYRTAGGVRLQDRGVTPDESTRLTRSDIYSRRDPAFEAAKRFLEK